MLLIRSIKLQIKRAVTGNLLMAALSITILHAVSAIGFMKESDVWYTVYNSMSTGITFFTIYLLPTMVFSGTVVSEIESGNYRFSVIRSGLVRYTISKIIATAIAGFLTVFIGISLYIVLLRIFLPLYVMPNSTSPYEALMETGAVRTGLLLFTTDVAMSGAVTACFGMVCSFFIPSRYTAITAPMMLFLTLSRITDALQLPEYMNAAFWMHSVEVATSAQTALLKKTVVSLMVLLMLGIVGVLHIYRRFQND